MDIKYIDGDIRIGNINYKYKEEDHKKIYCQMGYYRHSKKRIFIVRQRYVIITIYIFIHEFTHLLIHHLFNREARTIFNNKFDRLDYIIKKHLFKYRPTEDMIIKI